MILLGSDEIISTVMESLLRTHNAQQTGETVVKATGKKILIELQAIYKLPDAGMFHKKLGDFIQGLLEEVGDM